MILEDSLYKEYKDILGEYIDHHVLFRADPSVQYSEASTPGHIVGSKYRTKNTYQFYMRRISHNPQMLRIAVALMADHISGGIMDNSEHGQFQFCGLETGSIPLIAGLQMYYSSLGVDINAFTIRKERKDYGLFNYIEGMPNSLPVVMIDDLLNSGDSINKASFIIYHELGLECPMNCYSIIQLNDSIKYSRGEGTFPTSVPIFLGKEFSKKFDPEKYWLPEDVQKEINKRPEYK